MRSDIIVREKSCRVEGTREREKGKLEGEGEAEAAEERRPRDY